MTAPLPDAAATMLRDARHEKLRQYELQAEIVAGMTAMVEVSIDRVSVSGV